MRPELEAEVTRLRAILTRYNQEFLHTDPVDPEVFRRIEEETGITFHEDVRDFFTFSNGSGGEVWGAVKTDGITPLLFPMLEEAHAMWSLFAPYDDSVYSEWNDPSAGRDPRVRSAYVRHRLWFPLAEFDGYCVALLYDADPADDGRNGQMIVFQHDPDRIHYAAPSFLEFLKQSNDLLEAHGQEILCPEAPGTKEGECMDTEDLKRLAQEIGAKFRNQDGHSPGELVVATASSDMMSVLFGHNEGVRIALHSAVIDNALSVVDDLLERGTDVDEQDEFGSTALITAAGCGYTEMVRLLLDHGADVNLRDSDGCSALDRARAKGHTAIAELLGPAPVVH